MQFLLRSRSSETTNDSYMGATDEGAGIRPDHPVKTVTRVGQYGRQGLCCSCRWSVYREGFDRL